MNFENVSLTAPVPLLQFHGSLEIVKLFPTNRIEAVTFIAKSTKLGKKDEGAGDVNRSLNGNY